MLPESDLVGIFVIYSNNPGVRSTPPLCLDMWTSPQSCNRFWTFNILYRVCLFIWARQRGTNTLHAQCPHIHIQWCVVCRLWSEDSKCSVMNKI